MTRIATALRNTDHVIAHRSNAVFIENARRAAMRRDMAARRVRVAAHLTIASVAALIGILVGIVV